MHYKIGLLQLVALVLLWSVSACGSSEKNSSSTAVPVTSKLVINEIVASAVDGGSDWIEFFVVEGNIELSDYSIVDDKEGRELQSLPRASLTAGDYFVIQAIDENDTPPEDGNYVTFKLGSDDAVTLYKNAIQTDQLDWQDGEAQEGYSYGYLLDGSGTPQTLAPTPGETNKAAEVVNIDTVVNETAALRINEIVAKSNTDGLDWIELYVSGDTSVYLGDYYLIDDSGVSSSLPAITLASGEYYRIYATTKTDTGLETVNFKLGSEEQLRLFLDDDLIDQLKWSKGQALYNYSFGRFPDGSDAVRTLIPTPESANLDATPGPLVINEVVAITTDDSNDWFELFNSSEQSVHLVNYSIINKSDDIEEIHLPDVILGAGEYIVIYAVDEDPGDNYVSLKLDNNDELSLILNEETVDYIAWDETDVSLGFSYGLKPNGSFEKDTLSPTPAIENKAVTFFDRENVLSVFIEIDNDDWQDIIDNALDEEYHSASLTYKGVTLENIAIRTKGNSSLRSIYFGGSERFSFKIDINEYVDGQKFLGLKKFTLHNSFNDPSYMRETIAYDLLNEMGVITPQHSYVNFYINGQLHGLYLMVEAIDSEFLENNFTNPEGDLYKPDGIGSDLSWIDADFNSYSGVDLKTNKKSSDNGAFIKFIDKLNSGDVDRVFDVDSLLRYMSVSVALSNLDSYHGMFAHNYYIYEQDGVFSFLPWDLNETFGTFTNGCLFEDVRELYIDEPTVGPLSDKPLVAKAFENAEHLQTYHEYLWQLIDGPLTTDRFEARVNQIAELIDEHVANDPTALYSKAVFDLNQHSKVSRFYGLTSFINYRVNNMKQQLLGNIPSFGDGSGFCPSGR